MPGGGDAQHVLIDLIAGILGTKLSGRPAGTFHLGARGESMNEMETDGEKLVVGRFAGELASDVGLGRSPVVVDRGASLGDRTAMARKIVSGRSASTHCHLMEPTPAALESTRRRHADTEGVDSLDDREPHLSESRSLVDVSR